MTQGEKLEEAKRLYKDANADQRYVLERLFPELKESEDERIRKEILKYIKTGTYHKDWIAWLEKQGGQKEYTFKSLPRLLDMIEPTSRAKTYCQKLIDILYKEGYSIDAKIVDDCLKKMNGEDVPMAIMDEKQGEQKPTDKVEPKFKVGDKIIEKDFDECSCGTIINIKDGKYIFDNGGFLNIEEQGLWQLVEQKSAWSKEDKDMIETLVAIFEVNYPNDFYKVNPIGTTNMQAIHSSEIIKWLKSLKEKYTWKPSDEQMRILSIYADQNNTDGTVLTSLYNDLKKLKG